MRGGDLKGDKKFYRGDDVKEAGHEGRFEELTAGFGKGSIEWTIANAFLKVYQGQVNVVAKKARQREQSFDSPAKARNADMQRLLRNAYRVLLTRGIKENVA